MARDLNEAWGWIERLVRRVDRLYSGALLENSSITNGRMRFIGGLLRLDSGALLELIGQWRFFGNGAITGDVVAEGKWTQNGDWEFNGAGDIDGDVEVTGDIEVLGGGRIKVGNVIITPGSGGRITVGVGSAQVVIDGSTGKITAGNLTIDPTISDGAVVFANGAQVFTDGSSIQMFLGNGVAQVSNTEAKIQVGGTAVRVQSGNIYVSGMATKSVATVPGGFVGALAYDAGEMKRLI